MKCLLIVVLIFELFNVHAHFINEFTNYGTTNTPAFTGNKFQVFLVGKDRQIWAGTQCPGLYKFDTVTQARSKSTQLTNVFINDIKSDKNGGTWIAQSGTSGTVGGVPILLAALIIPPCSRQESL